MSCTSRFTPLCVAGWILAVAAQEAPPPQLTARELFYSAASEPAPAPAAKAPLKTAAKAPPKKTTSAPARIVTGVQPMPPVTTPPHIVLGRLPLDGSVIPAVATAPSTAPAPSTGAALGLKYTILKRSGSDMVEVPPDTVFHAGDRIQFSVQTNGPGYLYIVSQGSSGTWKPMFPSTEIEDGNNRVDGWHTYTMPPKSRMVFDEQTGVEKIFIVFSREPETDLENMIYSLQGNQPHPAAQPQEALKPKQMVQIGGLNIDDSTVGRLRTTYARDLIIERVDDKTPADKSDKQENAVYVVNPSGSSDSRVIADLTLVHQ
ncbi:MAG: DUF4384 domain-containing protein [Bryobacteraceae bacterium]|jgi:hypothetical protein